VQPLYRHQLDLFSQLKEHTRLMDNVPQHTLYVVQCMLTLSQGRGCDRHQLLNWLCCLICLFVCLLNFLPHFLPSLLSSFVMLSLLLIYFLTCLFTPSLGVFRYLRSATAPLLLPRRAHGTVCLTHCTDRHHWNNSINFWKLLYLKSHLRNRTVC